MYSYVDDLFAEYVPETWHSLASWVQNWDDGVLTHKSLLPVSMCNRKGAGGVPMVALT